MLQLCAASQIPNSLGPRCLVEAPLPAVTVSSPLALHSWVGGYHVLLCRSSVGSDDNSWWTSVLQLLSVVFYWGEASVWTPVLEHCSDSLNPLESFSICIQILWISARVTICCLFIFRLFYFQMLIGGCNNSTLSKNKLRGHFKQYISCKICGIIFNALCLVLIPIANWTIQTHEVTFLKFTIWSKCFM